jgi:hypothetical protein
MATAVATARGHGRGRSCTAHLHNHVVAACVQTRMDVTRVLRGIAARIELGNARPPRKTARKRVVAAKARRDKRTRSRHPNERTYSIAHHAMHIAPSTRESAAISRNSRPCATLTNPAELLGHTDCRVGHLDCDFCANREIVIGSTLSHHGAHLRCQPARVRGGARDAPAHALHREIDSCSPKQA